MEDEGARRGDGKDDGYARTRMINCDVTVRGNQECIATSWCLYTEDQQAEKEEVRRRRAARKLNTQGAKRTQSRQQRGSVASGIAGGPSGVSPSQ